ncbi:hypothetical protein ACIA47_07510 [Micromonospora sp. NPDC051227]|uniref:hypothetical protein n=1 Tax=Micromonospora sp. NPDC051227 TaxID=3364285 RepID=UPI00378DA56E
MVEELTQADDAIAACVDAAAWALSEHDLIAALDAAHRLEQRLAAVKLTLVREIDGRGTARAQGADGTQRCSATPGGAGRMPANPDVTACLAHVCEDAPLPGSGCRQPPGADQCWHVGVPGGRRLPRRSFQDPALVAVSPPSLW